MSRAPQMAPGRFGFHVIYRGGGRRRIYHDENALDPFSWPRFLGLAVLHAIT